MRKKVSEFVFLSQAVLVMLIRGLGTLTFVSFHKTGDNKIHLPKEQKAIIFIKCKNRSVL